MWSYLDTDLLISNLSGAMFVRTVSGVWSAGAITVWVTSSSVSSADYYTQPRYTILVCVLIVSQL